MSIGLLAALFGHRNAAVDADGKPVPPKVDHEPPWDHVWGKDVRAMLRERHGLTHSAARSIFADLFSIDGVIVQAVKAGKDVHLTGFGTFYREERTEGDVELPDGSEHHVDARNYLRFRTGATARREVR